MEVNLWQGSSCHCVEMRPSCGTDMGMVLGVEGERRWCWVVRPLRYKVHSTLIVDRAEADRAFRSIVPQTCFILVLSVEKKHDNMANDTGEAETPLSSVSSPSSNAHVASSHLELLSFVQAGHIP